MSDYRPIIDKSDGPEIVQQCERDWIEMARNKEQNEQKEPNRILFFSKSKSGKKQEPPMSPPTPK
jgi:hypothetical protein